MRKFDTHHGLVLPLDHSNVDTDTIIPKQYLKSVEREGFGENLFDSWRYLDAGEPGQDHSKRSLNPAFVLNQPRYANASVLLTRANFGCGSSREHAVWALLEYGIRVVIASGYSDIFYSNAIKNGLLAVQLSASEVATLFQCCQEQAAYALTVDLQQQILADKNHRWNFNIDSFDKKCLLEGLDEIALTLQHADKIRAYEQRRRQSAPWLFTAQDDT